ncbi:MAG: methylmalonyl Co-A mutase-associated GTPase MeaB [Bacteroidota bacterium]
MSSKSDVPANLNPNLRYQPRGLPSLETTIRQLRDGDFQMLSRAVTLLESQVDEHRNWSAALIKAIDAELKSNSFRLGISGSPGVGKSTFIEAFGLELIEQGHRVAVLAVDPSSHISGGSILGDKTRMEKLSRHPKAFVRPSPSGGFLGGVSRVTRESILLCETAGFDYILVETVGVGQSEMAVHGMTDAFLLLAQPGAGDELQGIKRGILEMADILVVNKVDTMPDAAKQAAAELKRSLHLAPARTNGWSPPVLLTAALQSLYIYEVYTSVEKYRSLLDQNGQLAVQRQQQRKKWLRELVNSELLRRLARDKTTQSKWQECDKLIDAGTRDIYQLAAELLRIFQPNQ